MSDFGNNLRWGLLCTAYFPLLSVLAVVVFAICSIPYTILLCVWIVCLPLLWITSLIPSDTSSKELIEKGFQAFILLPFGATILFTIYIVFYFLSIFTSPLWLLLGLINPELVIPDDFPANRWVVLFTYLIMPIFSFGCISMSSAGA
ncbi:MULTISPECIES: hypothetical protein [unclassified Chamaesiphon]|uniref:hypothetical protein n=1 Tax=unclassified Chamaesiphon TaxID=2620921 RepID=UPI00286C5DAD|nr:MULTISPECIES: hypothetical protein [unclassified Chamaesiphon]